MTPRAREEDLVIRELAEETLVYDLKRHKAHSLNPAAALVWRYCDGQTTVAEMTTRLQERDGIAADEEVVLLALDGLGRAHLLQERVHRGVEAVRYSRRELSSKFALTAGLTALLPVVTSIVAPTPAHAATNPCARFTEKATCQGQTPGCPNNKQCKFPGNGPCVCS